MGGGPSTSVGSTAGCSATLGSSVVVVPTTADGRAQSLTERSLRYLSTSLSDTLVIWRKSRLEEKLGWRTRMNDDRCEKCFVE